MQIEWFAGSLAFWRSSAEWRLGITLNESRFRVCFLHLIWFARFRWCFLCPLRQLLRFPLPILISHVFSTPYTAPSVEPGIPQEQSPQIRVSSAFLNLCISLWTTSICDSSVAALTLQVNHQHTAQQVPITLSCSCLMLIWRFPSRNRKSSRPRSKPSQRWRIWYIKWSYVIAHSISQCLIFISL